MVEEEEELNRNQADYTKAISPHTCMILIWCIFYDLIWNKLYDPQMIHLCESYVAKLPGILEAKSLLMLNDKTF